MNFSNWKRILICCAVIVSGLTVPAFSGFIPDIVTGICPECGGKLTIEYDSEFCDNTTSHCENNCVLRDRPGSDIDEHTWQETSRIPATCTASGSVRATCSNCHIAATEVLPQLEHDFQETSRRDATCTAPGSILFTCSRCSKTKTEPIAQLGTAHTWTETSRTDATCTAAGSIKKTCSTCGETTTESISALGHNWQETSRKKATCTTSGSILSTCSRCSETKTDMIPALGTAHTWIETSRTEPTASAPGVIVYGCSNCDAVKTEELPVLSPEQPVLPPSDLTMTGLLATLTTVFTAALSWVGTISEAIVQNPILLLCVVVGFIGTGVALFRRLLRANE